MEVKIAQRMDTEAPGKVLRLFCCRARADLPIHLVSRDMRDGLSVMLGTAARIQDVCPDSAAFRCRSCVRPRKRMRQRMSELSVAPIGVSEPLRVDIGEK